MSCSIPFLRENVLGLGVDMTTGTGWPFGGPNISKQMGAKTISFNDNKWVVVPTKQEVKRAAPGGEGLVSILFIQQPCQITF